MSALLEVRDLKKYFPLKKGFASKDHAFVKALDGISLSLGPTQTLSIVGESGCGKTTLAKIILKLIKPDSGSVIFQGRDITKISQNQFRPHRRDIQIIFQDPYSSLDPRFTVRRVLVEAEEAVGQKSQEQDLDKILQTVGLPKDIKNRFSFEFSGGQCQRISIARALIVMPKLLILDEPVSALDVSLQARILELLEDLQERLGISYLFISHNLRIVKKISDIIVVMYLGKILEMGAAQQVYNMPLNPYTQALISASGDKNIVLKGEIASNINVPSGCRFHTRCLYAKDICEVQEPLLKEIEKGHFSACHFADGFKMRGG